MPRRRGARTPALLASLALSALSAAAQAEPLVADRAPYTVRAPAAPENSVASDGVRPEHVLVIALDGVSWNVFRRERSSAPHLSALARAGFARPAESVFPSMTWSAHVSMVTGQHPRHHGILGNRWLERGAKLVYPYLAAPADEWRRARTPSLFELAAAKGLATAALNWPATQGSKLIPYNLPETMESARLTYELMSPALRAVVERMYARDGRKKDLPKDYLPTLLGRIAKSEGVETDLFVRDLTVELVAPRRTGGGRGVAPKVPRLLFTHLLSPDTWLHQYGTPAWVERWGLELIDGMIGHILRAYRRAGVWKKTAVFVVADHGFVEISHAFDLKQFLVDEGFGPGRIPPSGLPKGGVGVLFNGHTGYVYARGSGRDKLPKLVRLLRGSTTRGCVHGLYAPAEYRRLGLPVPPADESAEAAPPGAHPGAPDLLVLLRPHCIFGEGHPRGQLVRPHKAWRIGYHGFLPREPRLLSVFIGAGAGIKRQRRTLPRCGVVDLAPTVGHLLGLTWPARWPGGEDAFQLDGRVLRDVLSHPPGEPRSAPRRTPAD
ncbi:MAG: alkaline phosphatase family protein [Deltaproteobacteria bacterium]|nr:alkaline phosphatase family protein [Deltaproteobacteria bacterium]